MASISSTTSTSYNRITGLATGLDTDAMVKSALKPYQLKVDQAKQARDLQVIKQTMYRDSIKSLRELFTKYTDIAKPDSMLLTKNYGTSKFTSTDENSVTAEGLAGAKIGNYKVKVNQLAEAGRVEVDNILALKGQKIKVDVNGTSVDIDLTSSTLTESDIVTSINAQMKNAGVLAKVTKSDLSGKLIFETNSTGSNQTITLSNLNQSQTTLTDTGVKANVTITDSYGNTAIKEYDSNEFTIDNVKFKVTDVTSSAVSIVGKSDATALKDKLVKFVEDYNKVISDITTKLNEKKDYNYSPLTDEQKESMTEEQIEKWETKVKQGLLKRDNDLTQITSSLRRAFTDSIKGTGLTLKQLGIDFSSDTSKAGQLVVDEDKLTTALEENADEIVNLFAKSAPSNLTNKNDIYNNSGIFQRIKTILNDSVMSSSSTFLQKVGYEGTSTYSDNDITDDLLKREKQIKLLETNLKSRETKLYQKYATLETIMNNYNAQSSWLTQQFSS